MPAQYATQKNRAQSAITFLPTTTPILMYGVLMFFWGLCCIYLVLRSSFHDTCLASTECFIRLAKNMVWYSGIPGNAWNRGRYIRSFCPALTQAHR